MRRGNSGHASSDRGFIGLPLAQHLTSAGHEVIGLSRTAPTILAGLLYHVCADRGDAQAVAAAVKSGRIESVVDLLALTEEATRRLLDALEGANVVARSGIDWTILRLPMIFGPQDRRHRFGWLIRPLAAGAEHIAMPRPWAQWRTSCGVYSTLACARR
jgi:nucleoside-diphosphate-sugar epimerase